MFDLSKDTYFVFSVAEADPPVECNMGERSVCRDELETVTSTVPRPTAKQCIFFPVKEEERELRLDPSPRAESKSIYMMLTSNKKYYLNVSVVCLHAINPGNLAP